MSRRPRIAVGTIHEQGDATAMLWALMDALERAGLRVQSFLSRACFCPREGATAITGQPPRHLDSWLMDVNLCRDIFLRGSASCDLALVEGNFGGTATCQQAGGDLATLCQWLELPCLAIVDAPSLASCQLPERPARLEGLLLDRVSDAAQMAALQTTLESLWKVPVVGWLGALGGLRDQINATPLGGKPSLNLCRALGNELTQQADLERVYQIASRRKFPVHHAPPRRRHAGPLRVAVAYDEAFHCYFPDTLDLLELKGATVCDFSPLRDERLPPDTDLVYFGCGRLELFARQLAENDCMMLALKSHLSSGRRIYAEGAGLAYLCQHVALSDGQSWPMLGAVSATALLDPQAPRPRPAELTIARDTWLGEAPTHWAGYLNQRWSLAPRGKIQGCGQGAQHAFEVVSERRAVASRLHMNFAAREDLLDRFFEPCVPSHPRGTALPGSQ